MNQDAPEIPLLEWLIADVLRHWPHAASALRKVGLKDCAGCAMAPFETVREAAREYRLDEALVERALEQACRGGGSR